MKKRIFICMYLATMLCSSCSNELIEYQKGDLRIDIEKGEEWLHDFPVFLSINKKNPPQIAIWAEDMDGNYLSTIYVSHKIATQSWESAGNNRRKEALPYWCHQRGVQYKDGLYLPTKKHPLADGISGATPHGSFNVKLTSYNGLTHFIVKIELNQSTDFNKYYTKSAKEGEDSYSGGKEGSGQPAVIYAANVGLNSGKDSFEAKLIGHSSPDGSNGEVYPDVSTLTTALQIVKHITINIQQ